ncbi:hypothetical protein H8S95_06505 [Pontibacter sp. KCTC 32443]|uniref:hypothetical protein n=1 Tax=Pontibacter TaxID=323449 RepID=UPI00164E24EA|nr:MULTISPECIES: hypothetical protein [Pontibacter]MBC5773707.1 hypothetical protein [Pontibacter sp. KCTC 32443]
MELYSDKLIRVHYAAEQSILYADWQEQRPYSAAEVKTAFMDVVSSARDLNIKNLMLNFSDNTQDLTEEEYKAALAQLVVGLLPTTIRKIACVGTSSSVREDRILAAFNEIKESINRPLEFSFFSNRTKALLWLKK